MGRTGTTPAGSSSPEEAYEANDPTLARSWMKDHWAVMTAVAMRYAADTDEAEDIAQEAFWAAWCRRDRLQDPVKARSWLLAFVRNKGLHAIRARQRRGDPVHLEYMNEVSLQRWLASLSSQGRRSMVLAALGALPDTQAKLLRLILEGKTDTEVAGELGMKKSTLWVYKHRAIKKLRELYAGGGVGFRVSCSAMPTRLRAV